MLIITGKLKCERIPSGTADVACVSVRGHICCEVEEVLGFGGERETAGHWHCVVVLRTPTAIPGNFWVGVVDKYGVVLQTSGLPDSDQSII